MTGDDGYSASLDRFLEAVLANGALLDGLRMASGLPEFVALAMGLAARLDCAITADEIAAALHGASKRAARPASARDLSGWLPTRVHLGPARGLLDWCYLGDTPLADPFFDQTIARALQNPATAMFSRRTSIDVLDDPGLADGALQPTGFIFHMSRCGSTLVSQMLAALPQNIVVSEATPIDALINAKRSMFTVSDQRRGDWLRGMLAALGRPRIGRERHLFVKFDSWHVLELTLLKTTFPSVPWIFVYRNPIEVVASHARQGPGPTSVEAAMRRARVLVRFCESALRNLGAMGRLVEYRQLPHAVCTEIIDHFGIALEDGDLNRMRAAARHDAKDRSRVFFDDSKAKRVEVSEEVRVAVERIAMPMYDKLERRRNAAGKRSAACK